MSLARLAGGALAATLCLVSTPAHAVDLHSWGVGPHVGTHFLPGAYPSGFPRKIKRQDFDGDGEADDLDGDGTPDSTDLTKVRGDVELGVDAYIWLDETHRVGVVPGIDVGSRYTDVRFLLGYDYLFDAGQFKPFLGGAVGAGTSTFRTEGEERLEVPYYPLRAQAGLMVPDGLLGYQGRIFGQWNIPSSHQYTARDGSEKKVGTGFYVAMGLEISILFGNMEN